MVRSLMIEGLLVLAVALAFAGCGPSASNETAMENTAAEMPVAEVDPAEDATTDDGAPENTTAEPSVTEADPADKAASDETIVNSIGMKLVLIPPGEFLMGTSEQEIERLLEVFPDAVQVFPDAERSWLAVEAPAHLVRITRQFYLGIHEVTVGHFRKFVEQTQYKTEVETDGEGGWGWNAETGRLDGRNPKYTWRDPGWPQTDDHPVVNLTWNDAVAFCKWLSQEEGVTYRLPTEAEWEYACRAGSTTWYVPGNDPEGLAEVGNVADGTAKERLTNYHELSYIAARDGFVFSAPVGRFAANGFGLYDMHGNVWEWCADWFAADYYASAPTNDPAGPTEGSFRVYRGGSWYSSAESCRSAYRVSDGPDGHGNDLGFRVARSPSGKEGKPAGQPASKSGAGSGGRGGSNAQQERRGEVMSEEQSSAKKAVPSRDEISARVRPILVAALGVDEHEITPKATLVSDLGADGFDFLELVFRLEKEFGIEIPWNEMYPEEVLTNPKYVQAGRVNEAGLAELRRRLPFADLDRFAQNPRVPQPIVFPDFYTVDGLVRYVQSKL